jgi:hypothetical protein
MMPTSPSATHNRPNAPQQWHFGQLTAKGILDFGIQETIEDRNENALKMATEIRGKFKGRDVEEETNWQTWEC